MASLPSAQTRSAGAKSTSSINAAPLQCTHCGRAFARREHLERHIRIRESNSSILIPVLITVLDTRERPFQCTDCSKSYARRDVYIRHLRSHGSTVATSQAMRSNVHVACDTCHRRKVKCHSSESPCRRCKEAGLICTFTFGFGHGQRDSSSLESSILSPPALETSIDRHMNSFTSQRHQVSPMTKGA